MFKGTWFQLDIYEQTPTWWPQLSECGESHCYTQKLYRRGQHSPHLPVPLQHLLWTLLLPFLINPRLLTARGQWRTKGRGLELCSRILDSKILNLTFIVKPNSFQLRRLKILVTWIYGKLNGTPSSTTLKDLRDLKLSQKKCSQEYLFYCHQKELLEHPGKHLENPGRTCNLLSAGLVLWAQRGHYEMLCILCLKSSSEAQEWSGGKSLCQLIWAERINTVQQSCRCSQVAWTENELGLHSKLGRLYVPNSY